MGKKGKRVSDERDDQLHSVGEESAFSNAIIGLFKLAIGQPTPWKPHPPVLGAAAFQNYGQDRGTTPNKRGLWRVFFYLWAHAYGTAAQQKQSRELVVAFFQQQRRQGHCLGELVIAQTHGQLWMLLAAGAYFGGVLYKHADVIEEAGWWWRRGWPGWWPSRRHSASTGEWTRGRSSSPPRPPGRS